MTLDTFTDAFDILADAPGGIPRLRKLILQLAVQGRLVEQDPNDEPASVLLKHMHRNANEISAKVGYRQAKDLPAVSDAEKLFELPKSWNWVRLGEMGFIIGGGTPRTDEPQNYAEQGIAWLTPADLYKLEGKHIDRGKRDISEIGLKDSSAQLMPAGTVLFSSRAPIGYVAIAAKSLSTNQGFKSCVPFDSESSRASRLD